MDKILIIKMGALGDVVRTTSILRALSGEVTWVTKKSSFPLLHKNPFIQRVVDLEESYEDLVKEEFSLVINLDEEPRARELATSVKKSDLIGAYTEAGQATYTESSAPWFDMGLISKFGRKVADQKKWENEKSYQEIIFDVLGRKFKGEEYVLPLAPHYNPVGQEAVGLETRSGDRWVGKRWKRFPELADLLKNEKMKTVQFKDFPTLAEFMNYINSTDFVVTTDSLSLHIALGLKKRVVALFTCTSWHEIYGYHRTEKVVSPLIEKYFYNTTEEALKSGEAIDPTRVYEALNKLISSNKSTESIPL